MQVALSIAALLFAVAFVVLVVYLVMTLKAAQRTLDNVADTLEGLEKQLTGITHETTILLQKTNRLAEDVEEKSSKLNTVFDGLKGIGTTIQDFNMSLQNLTANITRVTPKEQDKASQAVKWGAAVIDLWRRKRQ